MPVRWLTGGRLFNNRGQGDEWFINPAPFLFIEIMKSAAGNCGNTGVVYSRHGRAGAGLSANKSGAPRTESPNSIEASPEACNHLIETD